VIIALYPIKASKIMKILPDKRLFYKTTFSDLKSSWYNDYSKW